MSISKPSDNQSAYLDFAQFGKLKQQYRQDTDAGIKATARQLEGVFLNMMLKSMREANAGFAEGNYLTGQESEYFRDMYDQQISQNLAARGGIGLADIIVRQMQQIESRKLDHQGSEPGNGHSIDAAAKSFDISAYRDRAIPALLKPELDAAEKESFDAAMQAPAVEAKVFAPATAARQQRQEDAKWNNAEEFVDAILPHATRAAQALNIDPMAIVAQAALETGWGQHVMRDARGNLSFNLFGIKAGTSWQGDTANRKTLEYRNGIAAQESATFRSYPTLESAFDDYVNFLKSNSRYQNAFQLNSEAKQWGYALQNAGYATDPNYGNKIARLLESDVLRAKAQTPTDQPTSTSL